MQNPTYETVFLNSVLSCVSSQSPHQYVLNKHVTTGIRNIALSSGYSNMLLNMLKKQKLKCYSNVEEPVTSFFRVTVTDLVDCVGLLIHSDMLRDLYCIP